MWACTGGQNLGQNPVDSSEDCYDDDPCKIHYLSSSSSSSKALEEEPWMEEESNKQNEIIFLLTLLTD
jgi:hypothetical protein